MLITLRIGRKPTVFSTSHYGGSLSGSAEQRRQQPRSGVSEAVWVWITGARKVNADTGAFAAYIRDYTERQHTLPTGQALDASDPNAIQRASDKFRK
jgi:hypothetical protein